MMISASNSDKTIIQTVVALAGKGEITHYDGKTGTLFTVSPCDNCGHPERTDGYTLERVSDQVHRVLTSVFRDGGRTSEFIGFDDDGVGYCEECADDMPEWM